MFCFVLTSPPLMLCVYLQTFEAALFWKKKKKSLIVAGKKECLKVSVVQMGSLSDFELLIHVFLVLKCRCVSAGMAIRPFIIL